MNLVFALLLLVVLAWIAAFAAYLTLGFDQAPLPLALLAIAVVLVLHFLLALLRGRDPFSGPALWLIRRRFSRSVDAERTTLEGAFADASTSSTPRRLRVRSHWNCGVGAGSQCDWTRHQRHHGILSGGQWVVLLPGGGEDAIMRAFPRAPGCGSRAEHHRCLPCAGYAFRAAAQHRPGARQRRGRGLRAVLRHP